MYHSGKNSLRRVRRSDPEIPIPRGLKVRRLHKAFLRYHDANNWPLLREALRRMGREDLIGNGKRHLVPTWQPAGTGDVPEGHRRPPRVQRRAEARVRKGVALTQHTGLPPQPVADESAGSERRRRGKRRRGPAGRGGR